MSSDVLAPRNLLMERGLALVTAVVVARSSLLTLFRSSIAAIVALIARTVIVATIVVYSFAWL